VRPGCSTSSNHGYSTIPVQRPWQADKNESEAADFSAINGTTPFDTWLKEPTSLGPYNTIAEVVQMNGSYTIGQSDHSLTEKATHGSKKHRDHHSAKKHSGAH
jgi:hypothetical protein